MNKNTILAIALLIAGTLLTTTSLTTMLPAVYAGGDDDGNKNKAEDDSAAAIADCDDNEVEQAGFDCFGIAVNDIDVDLGGDMVLGFVDGIPSVYPRN
ncbi:MAG TPA: hypothetical protein VFS97_10910 [Nitrososphaeraceae archaeon]|nr:hypothetical protein [Nitrososphaeraceae archaeon]